MDVRGCRRTVTCLGAALIFGCVFYLLEGAASGWFYDWAGGFASLSDAAVNDLADLFDLIMYILSFLLPALLFSRLAKTPLSELAVYSSEPPCDAVWAYFFAAGVLIAAGYVNNAFLNFLGDLGIEFKTYNYPIPDTPAGGLIYFLSLAVAPAVFEELLYRGVVLGALRKYDRTAAVLASAVLFAMMHCSTDQFFYACCCGIAMGWITLETGSMWTSMAVHFTINCLAFIGDYVYEMSTAACGDASIYEGYLVFTDLLGLTLGAVGAIVYLRGKKRGAWRGGEAVTSSDRAAAARCLFSPVMLVYALLVVLTTVYNSI